jgi:hypothetical protein
MRVELQQLIRACEDGNVKEVKRSLADGVKPTSLLKYAICDLESVDILQLLLENGFDIHTDANKIFNQWMGLPVSGTRRLHKPAKIKILSFISGYYLDKPKEIEKLSSSVLQKSLLFRIGLDTNNLNIMKFAVLIGVNKNEALNSALNRYYAYKAGTTKKQLDHDMIEYLLDSDVTFSQDTITNAVFFDYSELLDALKSEDDLASGYEVAYTHAKNEMQEYFIKKGLSKEKQNFVKMKVSTIKGDMQELHKVISSGADVNELEKDVIVQIINLNQVEVLKYLHKAGLILDISLHEHLNDAMLEHHAYDTISYLIEQGFDISYLTKLHIDYKKSYPIFADMWEKGFCDIFDYTIYLAREVHPKLEGKEKDNVLKTLAEFSTLPYVLKRSEERSHE